MVRSVQLSICRSLDVPEYRACVMEDPGSPLPPKSPASSRRTELDLESTIELVRRAKAGDEDAANALFARCVPLLRRWARGRLPRFAREMEDTEDLVQDTVVNTLRSLRGFEQRHEGALQAYLRQAVLNRIRDLIRRAGRHPVTAEVDSDAQIDEAASPLDQAIGQEAVERYERALQRLRDDDREAIVARVELQMSYAQAAAALGKPSADAARMAVARALIRLADEMSRERSRGSA